MPPRGRPPKFVLPERTLVIDNGAYSIKAGFASADPDVENDCVEIPNCVARAGSRVWVGDQLSKCTDFAEMIFRRPMQKGYLVNWEAEKEIWDLAFFEKNAKLYCDPHETNLVYAEAANGPTQLQSNCDQMIFEEFEFAAYRRYVGPTLNAYNDIATIFGDPPTVSECAKPAECLLVVDSGYSHTTVTPVYKGRPIQQAIRRIEVGGKFLTNVLKEMISVRQVNVQDETHMVDLIKQDACFVTSNFKQDLEKTRADPKGSGIVVNYVLPDYTHRYRGEIRPFDPTTKKQMSRQNFVQDESGKQEAILTLGNERFTVPELLFSPSDIGMHQTGLTETIMESMAHVPSGLWGAMLANVLVVGGTAKLPGFVDRLHAELRASAPMECRVRVIKAPDASKSSWLGGAKMASDRQYLKAKLVTRQEYLEHGSAWAAQAFASDDKAK